MTNTLGVELRRGAVVAAVVATVVGFPGAAAQGADEPPAPPPATYPDLPSEISAEF